MNGPQRRSTDRHTGLLCVATALVAVAAGTAACNLGAPRPPDSRREDLVETIHGVDIADPYRWLEDQQAPEVREWIDEQDAYTDRIIGSMPGGGAITARLTELMKVDSIGVPTVRNGRYFFEKRSAQQDLTVLYTRGARGEDEVLVDPNAAAVESPMSVEFADISQDGKLVAYTLRRGGEDEVEVRFLDVESGEERDDALERGRYFNLSLTNDGRGVFYDTFTAEGPRVFYRELGTEDADVQLVFGRGYGPDKIIVSSLSDNGRYLLITVLHGAGATRTELYFRDLWAGSQVHPIVNDVDAVFSGTIAADTLYVHTNWDAPRGRIFAADLRYPAPDTWTEIVPESDAVLQGIDPVGGRLFVRSLENVQPRVRILDPSGEEVGEIGFPRFAVLNTDPATGAFVRGGWTSDEAFFATSSLLQPLTIFRYRVSTREREVWARVTVPIEQNDFEVGWVSYDSEDGTTIPMFVAHRADLDLDGARPTLLTGYGGFDLNMLPGFNPVAALWIESGGVFAMPSLRGGGEFGEEWHRAGMLENKQTVFDDFIAAAEWLIDNGYTRPDKLAIRGGSNGGLLVGAAMTQRPELFGAVICTYPLLDMLRYHQFLVAPFWVPEYGSSQDPAQFEYLAAYSPYHRVRDGDRYPAVLLVTGDADTRVAPLHARKMTALLQAKTGSDNPILLMYDTEAGHSGGRPLSATIAELAAQMRFALATLGGDAR